MYKKYIYPLEIVYNEENSINANTTILFLCYHCIYTRPCLLTDKESLLLFIQYHTDYSTKYKHNSQWTIKNPWMH